MIAKDYLNKTVSIIQNFETEMDKDGSRFNIFSILNVSSNEVRLHSNFISELLNIKGTHSFGPLFFKLFKDSLPNNTSLEFDIGSANVEVEKSTGTINENYTSGGRIDIVITDKFNNRILIENKIFATDQQNQLLRYYNFDKNALLLYLTLDGSEPSIWSTNNEILLNKHYYCISYKEFISNWLKECIEKSKSKPKVSETISQYLDVIHNYTQQSKRNKMTENMIALIADNKKFYNSIEELNQAYNLFRQSIKEKFWFKLEAKRPNHSLICKVGNDIELKYSIEEDGDGFFLGFYIIQNDKRVEETTMIYQDLSSILKSISSTFNKNQFYIGWTFSKVFRKFWLLDKEKIFDLNDDIEMDKFIQQIVDELDFYIEEIKERVVCSKDPLS